MGTPTNARRPAPWLIVAPLVVAAVAVVWLLNQDDARPGDGSENSGLSTGATPDRDPAGGVADVPDPLGTGVPDGVVLPPDSPLHSRLDRPRSAILRGQITTGRDVETPPQVRLRLEPQAKSDEHLTPRTLELYAADPTFRFEDLAFGAWRVTATAPGYQMDPILLTLSEKAPDVHLLVPMIPANHLKGRVLGEDGGLVSGIVVTALPVLNDPTRIVQPITGTTDKYGEFDITGVTKGHYRLHAGPRFSPLSESREVYLTGAEAWTELIVPAFGRMRVYIRDSVTNAPVEGVKVIADGKNGHTTEGRSNAEGVVRFTHLPPDDYSLTAYSPSRRRIVKNQVVFAEQEAELEIRVAPREGDGR